MRESLQNRFISFEKLSPSIEFYGGKTIVSVIYRNGWRVLKSNNEKIKIAGDEENEMKYFYYADADIDINLIFDEIENTIKFNSEIEDKKNLLIEKINELKEIFETEDLSVLKTITFKYKKKRLRKVDEKPNENNTEINTEEQ